MGSVGAGTNSPLEETINICTESIYDQNNRAEGLNKSEFKKLLPLATKDLYFIFDDFFVQTSRWCSYGITIGTNSC